MTKSVRQVGSLALGMVALSVVGCGRLGEVQGKWTQGCVNSTTNRITFQDDRATFEQTKFADSACAQKVTTMAATGKFDIVKSNKEGVINLMSLQLDRNVKVVLHTKTALESANTDLKAARERAERFKPAEAAATLEEKAVAGHSVKLTQAAKGIADFKIEVAQELQGDALEGLLLLGGGFSGSVQGTLDSVPVLSEMGGSPFQVRRSTPFVKDHDSLVFGQSLTKVYVREK